MFSETDSANLFERMEHVPFDVPQNSHLEYHTKTEAQSRKLEATNQIRDISDKISKEISLKPNIDSERKNNMELNFNGAIDKALLFLSSANIDNRLGLFRGEIAEAVTIAMPIHSRYAAELAEFISFSLDAKDAKVEDVHIES